MTGRGIGVRSMRGSFVSLYSGAGGLDLGFAEAGWVPLIAVDADRHAADAHTESFRRLSARLPHLAGAVEPCRHMDVRDCLADLEQLGPVDAVLGGPPCQGFSVAGAMDPHDPRSDHVHVFLDAVQRVQPWMFVMENVPALAENRRWAPVLHRLRSEAENAGYRTGLWLLDAADHSVPQHRRRMFLVGVRHRGQSLPDPPTPEPRKVTVRETLNRLPPYGFPGNDTLCTAKVSPAKRPVLRRSPYAGMLFNGQGRPVNLDRPAPTLPASMGGNRTPIIDQHALDTGQPDWVVEYHARLVAGEPAAAHAPDRLRRLTVEEAAALQGFPDKWAWQGPLTARWAQIGNAVPPPLAKAVANAIGTALPKRLAPTSSPAGLPPRSTDLRRQPAPIR